MWSVVRFRMCWRTPGSALAVAALAIGCSDPPARVRLVPVGGASCKPMGATQVRVTAYGARGERTESLGLDEAVAIGDFPADTEQIGVEVLVGGGDVGAAGKSAPLAYGALADRATIPVMMAPPDGFCELSPMTEPRAQPVVARAGDGALVVGGTGPGGPLSTAEYYDPTTASFSPVVVPPGLADAGFTGTALATLPDGRVALIGGPLPVFVVFDPRVRRFVTDPTVIAPWTSHAAIATGDQEVLVAGGCTRVTTPPCDMQPALIQTVRYELGQLTVPRPSAILAQGLRVGARLFDLGEQLDGRRRFLLAGGSGSSGRADRLALDDPDAEVLSGGHTQTAVLDGSAVLTAFADDAASIDGSATVFAPGAAAATTIADPPGLRGARLIGLEDGRVVGFGGDGMGRVLTYDPMRDAWSVKRPTSTDQTGPLTAPSLARLADGSVLVVGGAVSARAWLYRPSLVGPASGSVIAVPTGEPSRGVLTAPDPASVTRVAGPLPAWLLATPAGADMARALVGGPRTATGSVSAIAQVLSGGVALIAQQTAPGRALLAELAPDSPPRLVRLADGAEHELCTGPDPVAFDAATPVTLRFAITTTAARLTIGPREVLSCSVAATDRGAWGIASLGPGAQLAVDSVTVAR
jgi:hypothetical protein